MRAVQVLRLRRHRRALAQQAQPQVLVHLLLTQPAAAVAGVQLASRQHKPLALFHVSAEALRQLSTFCATAEVASAAEAINIANVLSFFMVLLMGIKPQTCCVKRNVTNDHHPSRLNHCATA